VNATTNNHMKEIRPRLNEEEWKMVQDFRGKHSGLNAECEAKGIPIDSVNHYWYKGDHYSIHAKIGDNVEQVVSGLIEEMKKHSPRYPTLVFPKLKEGHLLVIDPADVHLNKLCSAYETGDEYNIEIAEKRLMDGVQGILEKVQGFHIEQILFISGNDKLHVDTPKSTTTGGTFQDTHLMWYDAFRFAVKAEVKVLEMLLPVAPVHYQYDPSNHDYTNGFFMAQTIEAWFKNCEGITFNTSISHRKYFTYGQNLIGTTHGDGAKEQDLPLLMAHEAAKDWGTCKHKYIYTHHIHHKKSKDYMGVCVESLRSPSGTDSWHHRNGYQHSPKAIEGFLHHREHGQIARITHLF
jgi:hypothetical protein